MIAEERIYTPGPRPFAEPQPKQEILPNVEHRNSKGHPETDDEHVIQPFPIASLPPKAARMASAIARMERTPEALAGCCTLGILSASIGAGLHVRSGPDRYTRGNLYILTSADSG